MNSNELAMRVASSRTGLSSWLFRSGRATDRQIDVMLAALDDIRTDCPYYVDETSAPSLTHMQEQLVTIQDTGTKIAACIFDYMELAKDEGRNETHRIGGISRGLKGIAKALDIPVITLAQFSRDIERRAGDNKPKMSDIMYGGEQPADIIIALTAGEKTGANSEYVTISAHVLKNRNGPLPSDPLPLLFDGQRMKFRTGVQT